MIATLRGELRVRGEESVLVDVGGIGFRLLVPGSTLDVLGEIGENVRLYTHLLLRDDNLSLYGFATPEELELFELLLGVSGVGPKLALAVLSSTAADMLRLAIAREDVDLLVRVPGIGRKTASRMILELKGRIDISRLGLPGVLAITPEQAELVEVLTSLGYSTAEARSAVASLPPEAADLDLEERIRWALRYFGGV
ncbi:MAG: Holliday junction branch migration protein RuvA [Chloroflexia bacterium]|nr:Holliday junction branch migration protein RuvA [Chloroflexia bacterium]